MAFSPQLPLIGTPHIICYDQAGSVVAESNSNVLSLPDDNANLFAISDVGGARITLGDGNNGISTFGNGNVVVTGGVLSQVLNQGTGNITFFHADHPVTWDAVNLNSGDAVAIIGDAPGTVLWANVNGQQGYHGLTREDFTPDGQAHFTTFTGINATTPQAAGLSWSLGTDPASGKPFALVVHS